MPRNSLEGRLAVLEQQVVDLRARLAALESPRDWRSTAGMFTGDEVMKEIFEEGRKIREAERKAARRAGRKIRARAGKS